MEMNLVKSLHTINIAGPEHHSVKVREYGSADRVAGSQLSQPPIRILYSKSRKNHKKLSYKYVFNMPLKGIVS